MFTISLHTTHGFGRTVEVEPAPRTVTEGSGDLFPVNLKQGVSDLGSVCCRFQGTAVPIWCLIYFDGVMALSTDSRPSHVTSSSLKVWPSPHDPLINQSVTFLVFGANKSPTYCHVIEGCLCGI